MTYIYKVWTPQKYFKESVCLSVSVFTFEVPFKRLFAPTSQSWMSRNFKDSESFGKSNGKKWSQIWNILIIKGVKLPCNTFFYIFLLFCEFRLNLSFIINLIKFRRLEADFLVSVLLSASVKGCFVSRMQDFSLSYWFTIKSKLYDLNLKLYNTSQVSTPYKSGRLLIRKWQLYQNFSFLESSKCSLVPY